MSTEDQADIEVAIGTEASRFLPMETLSVRLTGSDISSRDPVFGIIANMSMTGACLISNRGLPKDSMIEVSISSRMLEESVTLPARVIWCAEQLERVREIVGYLTGVKFNTESEETVQNLLSTALFQPVS